MNKHIVIALVHIDIDKVRVKTDKTSGEESLHRHLLSVMALDGLRKLNSTGKVQDSNGTIELEVEVESKCAVEAVKVGYKTLWVNTVRVDNG